MNKQFMNEDLSNLLKIKEVLEKQLKKAPKGRLKIANVKGNVNYFYDVIKDGETKTYYLKKSQKDFVNQLAQKSYNKKLKKLVEEKIRIIKKISKYENIHLESVYENLSKDRKPLVSPIVPSNEQKIKKWLSKPRTQKGFENFEMEIYTKKGERVRSKSEKILADLFFDMGVEYKYEESLYLSGFGTIYPDFTFYDPIQNKEIYWEHFGKMDDAIYVSSAIRKIETYIKNGILLGDRLVITFETATKVLDVNIAKNLVLNHILKK